VLLKVLSLILSAILGHAAHSGVDLPTLGPVPNPHRSTPAQCDRWAAPPGRRVPPARRPALRSVPALTGSLRAGETGCLVPGRYRHSDPAKLRRPGSALLGVGSGVRVDGAVWVTGRARGSQIRGLDLTASDPVFFIPLKVQADRVLVAENRIRGARSTTCVLVGSTRRATGVRIERNWIHHCGRRGKLDHLIYLQQTRGALVRGNVLDGNPGGWGVHMYPDADGTRIERNLIDGNRGGVIFAGDEDRASERNLVRWNVIGFSRPRWNVEASWGGTIGAENVAHSNCLYGPPDIAFGGIGPIEGFRVANSAVVAGPAGGSPGVDRYRLARRKRCARLVEPLPPTYPGVVHTSKKSVDRTGHGL